MKETTWTQRWGEMGAKAEAAHQPAVTLSQAGNPWHGDP